MDPTAALNELLDALRNRDCEVACDRLQGLLEWLHKDGLLPSVPDTPIDTRYQGWTNHATWATSLWLNNDEGTYLFCRRLAREAVADADDCEQVDDGIWTVEEARRYLLADSLGEYLDELNPLKEQPASLFSDLLTASLQDVNFVEIAKRSWTTSIRKGNDCSNPTRDASRGFFAVGLSG